MAIKTGAADPARTERVCRRCGLVRVSMWIAGRAAPGCERPDDREARTRVGLLNKGVVLGRLERHEEAVTTFDALVQQFGNDEHPSVRPLVAAGLSWKSAALVRRWWASQVPSLLEEAIAAGRLAVAVGGRSYNLACSLALAERFDEAFQLLETSLRDDQIEWQHVQQDEDWAHLRQDPRCLRLHAGHQAGGESCSAINCVGRFVRQYHLRPPPRTVLTASSRPDQDYAEGRPSARAGRPFSRLRGFA